jgi:hypothetical protein
MKSLMVLGLALAFSGGWFGCSTAAQQPEMADTEKYHWGDAAGGFQLAAWSDETHGIIHCLIRNATTNQITYPSFDFGYMEFIQFEVQTATNWTNVGAIIFPRGNGASDAVPYLVKQIDPGQIVTITGYPPPPGELRGQPLHDPRIDFLQAEHGDTNKALLDEQGW